MNARGVQSGWAERSTTGGVTQRSFHLCERGESGGRGFVKQDHCRGRGRAARGFRFGRHETSTCMERSVGGGRGMAGGDPGRAMKVKTVRRPCGFKNKKRKTEMKPAKRTNAGENARGKHGAKKNYKVERGTLARCLCPTGSSTGEHKERGGERESAHIHEKNAFQRGRVPKKGGRLRGEIYLLRKRADGGETIRPNRPGKRGSQGS